MSFFIKLQNIFGVSKSELTVVIVVFAGLVSGLLIQQFDDKPKQKDVNAGIYASLDSLAETQKTTYTGTDIRNNKYTELAQGDTIVKKTGFFKKPKISSGTININTASKLELMRLPGVGESTALKIMDYRSKHPFNSPENMMNIKGIGPKKYEKMKPFIEVK